MVSFSLNCECPSLWRVGEENENGGQKTASKISNDLPNSCARFANLEETGADRFKDQVSTTKIFCHISSPNLINVIKLSYISNCPSRKNWQKTGIRKSFSITLFT